MGKEYLSFVREFEQEDFEFVDGTTEHLFVGEISSVNILVGANNSRKSRFLRLLAKMSELPVVSAKSKDTFTRGIEVFNKIATKVGDNELINVDACDDNPNDAYPWLSAFDGYSDANAKERYGMFRQGLRQTGDRLVFDKDAIIELKSRFIELFNKRDDILFTNNGTHIELISGFFGLLYQNHHKTMRCGSAPTRIAFDLLASLRDESLFLNQAFPEILTDITVSSEVGSRVFIPSLRGSLPFYDNSFINSRLYERTTNELYFTGKNVHSGEPIRGLAQNASIYAGDDLHRTILNDKNSTKDRRRRFEQFQNFIGNHFFNGRRVEVVSEPDSQSKKVMIDIEGEEERELKDVGDGIQQLIILLHPIFMAEENTWILIDEPELSLHPGFQNLFLDTILNNPDLKAKNLHYFMTTHSNHFLSHALRSPDEVSVFNFSQHNKDQSIIRCVHGDDTSVLDQLGVENASVYMANCSIWVEGVSDRRYLQAFLKAYCQKKNEDGNTLFPEFKEGLDYTFFEYAGTNLTHYLFNPGEDDPNLIDSFKNANRIFLLADQDAGKDDKHDKLHALKSDNFEYQTTGAREVENMLPPFVYQDFIASYPPQKDATFTATHQDYMGEYMGKFLREHIGASSLKYGEKTLTTKYKNDLSELVQDKNYTWDKLSESADIVRITKAVYDFIKRHNTSRN